MRSKYLSQLNDSPKERRTLHSHYCLLPDSIMAHLIWLLLFCKGKYIFTPQCNMKRHPSLIPLSRFHRSVLFLALVCKKNAPPVKGYPQDLEGKRDYATSFYNRQLKAHMDLEEEQLFPQITHRTGSIDELVRELIREHREIDERMQKLPDSADLSSDLDQLGLLLEKHVRKEERQLFQQVQEALTEPELEALKL